MDRMAEKIEFIAEHNGLEKVLDKLAEECAEYTAARLQYHERKTDDWIEELADVWILMRQARILIGCDSDAWLSMKFWERVEEKIERQIGRVKEYGGKIPDL